MIIAHKDIENQAAQAIIATPSLAQVLIIARSQSLLDTLSHQMAADDNVQGHTLRAEFVEVVHSGTQNWDLLNFVVFQISDDMAADLNAIRKLLASHKNRLQCLAVSQGPMSDAVKECYLSAGVAEVLVLDAEEKGALDDEGKPPRLRNPPQILLRRNLLHQLHPPHH